MNNPLWTKFDAFIIDNDIDTRMRLRQATSSVPQFGKVVPLNNLREATSKLASGVEHCDVLFLSCRFTNEEISGFVKGAKETKGGQDTAYILVLDTNRQDSTTVANSVMIGVDGFLFEPYSVDQLVDITTLAAKVKAERSLAREQIALTLLVTDMINQIDLVSYLRSMGLEPSTSLRKLKELCVNLPNMSEESKKIYYGLLIENFINADLPKKMFRAEKEYKGASSRVKKKMAEKIAADAEKMFADQKEEKRKELAADN